MSGVKLPQQTGCFHKALPNVRSAYVTLQDIKKLHRYVCHICDISQLWPAGSTLDNYQGVGQASNGQKGFSGDIQFIKIIICPLQTCHLHLSLLTVFSGRVVFVIFIKSLNTVSIVLYLLCTPNICRHPICMPHLKFPH